MTEDPFEELLRESVRCPGAASGTEVLPPRTELFDGRYRIISKLGEGGTGVVYRAFDAERREEIALKMLLDADAHGLARIKREFRALADVSHANLVTLYELVEDAGSWFFTMQLVEGVDVVRFVRRDGKPDLERLRSCLCQMVAALDAIHSHGLAHRDLKPSNTLVRSDGSLVLLDFGLAAPLPSPIKLGVGRRKTLGSGTPDYMAPELFLGASASPASDFYSLGVVLFEALFGQFPFATGVSPAERIVSLPKDCGDADIADTCLRLLSPNGSERPTAADWKGIDTSFAPPRLSLFGRAAELSQLHEIYQTVSQAGNMAIVSLSGVSGIGKSTLVDAFLQDLASADARVLRGRCYPNELVPYNAFDRLVEELGSLGVEVGGVLADDEEAALLSLFPTLSRLRGFTAQPNEQTRVSGSTKRRAFEALAALLATIASKRPLIIWIDDAHWADEDSVVELQNLLAACLETPTLVLFSCREEEGEHFAEMLQAFLSTQTCVFEDIRIGPLSAWACSELLATIGTLSSGNVSGLHEGNPLLISLLAYHGKRAAGHTKDDEAALRDIVGSLPSCEQAVLKLVSIAVKPLRPAEVEQILRREQVADSISRLRAGRLVSIARNGGIQPYHDRVRQAALAMTVRSEKASWARTLAALLKADPTVKHEHVAVHLREAGELDEARALFLEAAEQATNAQALARAAQLYREALRTGSLAPAPLREILRERASLLDAVGDWHAPDAYLDYAAQLPESLRFEPELRAEELRARSEHPSVPLLLARVAQLHGLPRPRSVLACWLRLIAAQLQLEWLGRRAPFGSSAQAPSAEQVKWFVVLRAFTLQFQLVDPIRFGLYSALLTIQMMKTGVASLSAGALSTLSSIKVLLGQTDRGMAMLSRAEELMRMAEALPEDLLGDWTRDHPWLGVKNQRRIVDSNAGIAALMSAGFRASTIILSRCEQQYEAIDRCSLERQAIRVFNAWAQFFVGDLRRMHVGVPMALASARLGRWAASERMLLGVGVLTHLARDQRGLAEAHVKRWDELVPPRALEMSGLFWRLSIAWYHLYRDEAAQASACAASNLEALLGTLMLRPARIFQCLYRYYRAATQLVAEPHAKRSLKAARKEYRKLQKVQHPLAKCLAPALGAALAHVQQDAAATTRLLRQAAEQLQQQDMAMFAAAARYWLGHLQGNAGAGLEHAASLAMRTEGVVKPEHWAAMLIPMPV